MTLVPEPVARVVALMSTFQPWWSLCGGWAVDAWLGRPTRDHHDVDLTVFVDDQSALFDHLTGWRLVAHDQQVDGDTLEPWSGRPLELPAHVHARSEDGVDLEVLVNARSGGNWLLDLEHGLTLPLGRCVGESAWGVPTVVPEVLLFYKATAYFGVPRIEDRPQDEGDFRALLPLLDAGPRAWLRQAVALIRPGHPWLIPLA